MKLEDPLLNLVARCQTICVAECCGIGAYDFSPVHIASYLLLWQGKIDQANLTKLMGQLVALKANYGSSGASSQGVTLDDINQNFTGAEIDKMVDEITANLKIALKLCDESERMRYNNPEPSDAAAAGLGQ